MGQGGEEPMQCFDNKGTFFKKVPGEHAISMTITDDVNLDLLIKVGIIGFATVNSLFFPFHSLII